jgi:hypothetical protein
MSNRRYIQVSSGYRDREKYPLASRFEVLVSQTGNRTDAKTAYDPILDSYPQYQFIGNSVARSTAQSFNGGNYSNVGLNTSVSNIDNFYSGYQVTDTTLNQSRIILEYVGQDMLANLDRPYSSTWSTLDNYTLQDPSLGSTTKDRTSESFTGGTRFLPVLAVGAAATNGYYNGMTITDTTIGESRTIVDYNAGTNAVTVFEAFSVAWNSTDTYTIQASSYKIVIQPQDSLTGKAPSDIDQYYNGDILEDETLKEFRYITNYNSPTRTLTIEAPFSSGWALTDSYSIRKSRPKEQNTFVGVPNPAPNYAHVQLNPVGPVTEDYTNYYLYPREGTEVYFIKTHDLDTNIITVNPNPGSSFTAGSAYDILQFTRDNVVPMSYTGTPVGPSNYEIELIDLILPNVELKTGTRVSFYPYFFVEFTNANGSTSVDRNIIYSNNPNSTKQLFIAPIDDTSNPLTSRFLKLSQGSAMRQVVRFNPYDNVIFSLTLPNGSPFETLEVDNYSPLPPLPELQISAIFSIKRL